MFLLLEIDHKTLMIRSVETAYEKPVANSPCLNIFHRFLGTGGLMILMISGVMSFNHIKVKLLTSDFSLYTLWLFPY